MRALFGRKIENIVELREATERSRKLRMRGTVYTVDREVEMTDDAFREFGNDFLKDQPWILKTDGDYNEKGEYRCIRVINVDTGERLLVSSEGFEYLRYIGIEPDD
ncbi:hypothetical protein [Proteiniclasticum ruminis]|uniref:hypothetical protein n=1 Tax=Proteiniclasticum ruminis TaxID=398199 RepID=UPI0028AE43E1|nr:hypothetical protein [Proteiniclasticum ruminis]